MSKVMVTGASGFIGKFLCASLAKQQMLAQAIVRDVARLPVALQQFATIIPNLSPDVVKQLNFSDIDCVIHLAATAHIPVTGAADELDAYRKINCETTLALAKAAVQAGVRRFIFISSIGVNGVQSDQPFKAQDTPAPKEPYAVSKYEAEQALRKLASETELELVIIRPPLVYGHDAPGNFGKLCRLVRWPLPLPLGAIKNKRSLVSQVNLVDLILNCINHPRAIDQIFLVSDDRDVSTTELLTLMSLAACKQPWLLPIPIRWLELIGKLTGRKAVIDRLCGNLQVDITHTKEILGWKPPISVEEGIKRCFSK